jgi:hypothetical protein
MLVFKKKPYPVKAIRYLGTNCDECAALFPQLVRTEDWVLFEGSESTGIMAPGDWLVEDKGTRRRLKDNEFEAEYDTFEEVAVNAAEDEQALFTALSQAEVLEGLPHPAEEPMALLLSRWGTLRLAFRMFTTWVHEPASLRAMQLLLRLPPYGLDEPSKAEFITLCKASPNAALQEIGDKAKQLWQAESPHD